ncbi:MULTISPECIES: hypothetical protein [unclassified Streptomyces]|uniref:hypothetical protein n=1 Tax=unclassified Streptomyces TaxID=2593676 RepID=UPI0023663FFA|nr:MULTISPECIES: hypothetical protein [unclassified Streptomyces]MDF3147505.1 hypothetical protein [Streptomyces sp. T21Q-yed]WDF43329.1 hypothetical protein PBV52_44350 [Streptomyces sp. T12]
MDLQMPGMDADLTAAIEAGAVGCLLKDSGRHELCETSVPPPGSRRACRPSPVGRATSVQDGPVLYGSDPLG